MSTWPQRPRVRLATHWRYRKRSYRLTHGTYDWYVWPSFGRRYGAAIGHSTFVVR